MLALCSNGWGIELFEWLSLADSYVKNGELAEDVIAVYS